MAPSLKTAAALVGALAGVTRGHAHVSGIVADGVYYGGFSLDYYYEKQNTGRFTESVGWYTEALDNGFVAPDAYNTSDIVCHRGGQPANRTATVAGGGTVEFQWTNWAHPGPVLTYVARCPDADPAGCTAPALDKAALAWVKIDEAGYSTAPAAAAAPWAAAALAAANNSWTITVPPALVPGNYVFRHEIIAVHGAQAPNGAQNYPQCVNIAVTAVTAGATGAAGVAGAAPAGTRGDALYTATDPGILFNPYTTITNYTVPGPALMEGVREHAVAATGAASTAPSAAAPLAAPSAAPAAATNASSVCQYRRHARVVGV